MNLNSIDLISGERTASPDSEDFDQDETGDKAANVGRVGDTALLRSTSQHTQAADQLKCEPDANGNVGGHIGEETKQDNGHPLGGIEQNIASQHSRNRPRSAQTWYQQTTGVSCKSDGRVDVRQRREHAANKIKGQIAQVAHSVFDIVSEDPEEEHVSEDV